MSEENKYDISDLITSATLQQPVEFQSAFDSLVLDRIKTAVENRKIEVAQSMYNNETPEDIETDINDDEFGASDVELENSGEQNGEES
jgi:hypothetical protein